MALAEEVVDEYKTSLADLNFNSKPLINMLTMLAEDHEQHAPSIVKVIEDHINKCKPEKKLPALYLMDSIMKNLEKTSYRSLISRNIAKTFTSVFEKVDEKTRSAMYKLRQTWTPVLPNAVLYKIDKTISSLLDPAWPITAKEPEQTSIHVNPRFLQGSQSSGSSERSSPDIAEEPAEESEDQELYMRQQLIAKQQELLSLKEARLKLELAEAEEKLKQQKKQVKKPPSTTVVKSSEPHAPEEQITIPRDPRQRPQDPRLRDPRLKNQPLPAAPGQTSLGPAGAGVAAVIAPRYPVNSMAGIPSGPGPMETQFMPVSSNQYPGNAMPPVSLPYNDFQAPGVGMQTTFPPQSAVTSQFDQGIPPMFSGEMFEEAKFSDEYDSESSRSSFQEANFPPGHNRSNLRDPRRRIDQMTENRSDYDSSPDLQRLDKQRHERRHEQLHKDRYRHGNRHTSVSKESPVGIKEPRLSKERESLRPNRNSKGRDILPTSASATVDSNTENKHVAQHRSKSNERDGKRKVSESADRGNANERNGRSKSSDRLGRSVSKERTENKMESKPKDTLDANRGRKEEDRKKSEEKDKKKDVKKSDSQKVVEIPPHKSTKQSTASSNKVNEEKKSRKVDDKNVQKIEVKKKETAGKKGGKKSLEKRESQRNKIINSPDKNQEHVDIDERRKALKEPEKRAAVDREEIRVVKKPKLEEKEMDQFEGPSDLEVQHMDIDSDSEQPVGSVVPKIDDDISDLFGDEDEDYRPMVPKTHLPLKSPSSKGWDQFKASQPEQYAYDIELKKQRQDSLVEERTHRSVEEPQDVDLRMNQPEFQHQMQEPIPPRLLGSHSEILLQAGQKLKEGLITPEEHQDVLRNLGKLMQLQEKHNRRLSEEQISPREQMSDSDLWPTATVQPGLPNLPGPVDPIDPKPGRDPRSPDRHLEAFKIPKKSPRGINEEEHRKELSNLYPESPIDNHYNVTRPFAAMEELHTNRDVLPKDYINKPPQFDEKLWTEDDNIGISQGDYGKRISPDKGLRGTVDVPFDGPLEEHGPRGDKRVVPENQRGPHGDSAMRRPEVHRGDFEDRSPRDMDRDRRGLSDMREPGAPFRGDWDRRTEDWDEEGPWQDRFEKEPGRSQRGRRGGHGRGFARGGSRAQDAFEGTSSGDFEMGKTGRPDDVDWRDSRRKENWRDNEEPRTDRGAWRRGPGRFGNDRNEDDMGPSDEARGRGRRDRLDRRYNDRNWKGRSRHADRQSDDWQESPQWDKLPEDDGRTEPVSHRLTGPFGRPGHPGEVETAKPENSPKKGAWRDRLDNIPPDERLQDENVRGPFDEKDRRHGGSRHFHDRDREFDKPKPRSLLEMDDIRPAGPRVQLGSRGVGPRGPRFDGPNPDARQGLHNENHIDSYIDKFGDPRFRCFVEMGPVVSEEVVIGKRNFEIKLGAPPRKIAWGKDFIEVFADPSKRGIVIDGNLMYRFGERVKDVTLRNSKVKLFYHGRPINFWLDGQIYEVRVDAPPKQVSINGKMHRVQIDGRDMMILIDKEEKGRFGGEPRFIFIDEERMELRFDPPPRHILIDGNLCELKLNTQQPCVNIKGVLHGIRFDGPPRQVLINGQEYQIYTDHAVKLRIGNKFHYVALGGPCHEIIVDGRWFDVKFNEPPKEVCVGNQVLMIQLRGSPPEVKILPEIGQIPLGIGGPIRPDGMPMPGPGPQAFMGPRGPGMPPGNLPVPGMPLPGPPMGPGPNMPMPGPMGMQGPRPIMQGPMPMGPMQPGSMHPGPMQPGLMQQDPMGMPVSTAATSLQISGQPLIPGIGSAQSVTAPMTTVQSGVPDVLSSLFPSMPPTSTVAAPLDINSLFAKLVNTGIIKKEPEVSSEPIKPSVVKPPEYANAVIAQKKVVKEEEKFEDVPDMTEMEPNEMKCLPVGMIQRLYAGLQCTSCGQRFHLKDGEKTDQYRQHLDWHFRQNRKEKADTKVTNCRKWYYGIDDWIQYEEVVDSQEKVKSFFDQQPATDVTPEKPHNQLSLVVPLGVSVIKCPPATGNDNDDMCNICKEVFEQYWDEELEEWHLRDAIKVNNKTYHPICYEDLTDVSEGTPSPSTLSVTEPGFSSRKALTYDEASQDGHHASFEEERKISTASPEPIPSASLTESAKISVKSEPVEYSLAGSSLKIKHEPKSPITSEHSTDVPDGSSAHEKVEPKTEYIKTETAGSEMDTKDNKDVSQGSDMKGETVKQELEQVDDQLEAASDLVTVVKTETEEPTDTTANSEGDNTMETDSAEPAEEKMETNDDIHVDSAIPESDPHVGSNVAITDNVIRTELAAEDSTQSTSLQDYTTSDIHIETSSGHLVPPEGTRPAQHSPTYSKLCQVKLAITPEPIDITSEVLEIGSNASTPTRDELPSPPGNDV